MTRDYSNGAWRNHAGGPPLPKPERGRCSCCARTRVLHIYSEGRRVCSRCYDLLAREDRQRRAIA